MAAVHRINNKLFNLIYNELKLLCK